MPEYLAPGVYVEEIQTGNKPIEGVSTSTSGLIGVTERGPVNVPQLVTSYGEYRRLFGGYLLASDFTDGTGRVHAYLPHAIEGFFINGGKRAYITRVLPDVATFAARNLFFADPSLANPGDTAPLRSAQQATGTAVNLPLLYVLDPDNFLVDDWVRIGDGSRAEYRRVQAISPARHVSLNFPTHYAHPAGALVSDMEPDAALANLNLAEPAVAGATALTVGGTDVPNLIAALALAGSRQLLQFGPETATAAEYIYATAAVAAGDQAAVTLDTPLQLDYATGTVLAGMTSVAQDNLDLAASAGQILIFMNSPGADFADPTHVLVIGVGSTEEEVISIGHLAAAFL